jgi:SMI1 / KNR4 family.
MKSILINDKDTGVRLEKYASTLPTPDQIDAFEQELGYSLPADYKEFLLKYNGGTCELKNIIMPISGYLCDLFGFYDENKEPSLIRLKLPTDEELIELWGQLPSDLLPIGEVDSGDMIAIKFYPDKAEIVVIDHEDDQLDIILREKSFSDFLMNTKREE